MAAIEIRDMTEGDLAKLGLNAENFWGKVGYRRGVLIGYGAVFWGEDVEPTAFFGTLSTGARPIWLAVVAKKFLREMPFETLQAFCNHEVPRSQEFLTWLGFEPTDAIEANMRVWKWRRR